MKRKLKQKESKSKIWKFPFMTAYGCVSMSFESEYPITKSEAIKLRNDFVAGIVLQCLDVCL